MFRQKTGGTAPRGVGYENYGTFININITSINIHSTSLKIINEETQNESNFLTYLKDSKNSYITQIDSNNPNISSDLNEVKDSINLNYSNQLIIDLTIYDSKEIKNTTEIIQQIMDNLINEFNIA